MTNKPAPQHNHAVVYIIDDDQSVRDALEDLLQSVGLDVHVFASTQAFLQCERADVPACLVLDIRMPGQSGMAFHRTMAESGIHVPVIFITGHGDIAMSVSAMKHGAIDFLTKPFSEEDLLDAIYRGIETDRIQRAQHAQSEHLQERWTALTPGEQDVMRLVVQGLLNKQIASELQLSEVTIKVRRASVMRKMEVKTLADLVRLADKIRL